ncbi:glycosyltransferase family 2 protein [Chitinophaga sp.]|uniref:glycosyltransferase family 2 protein n=1 Tax=Chitinophaga sp. TaxID=1869181 RepID=UPI0031CEF623
MKNRNFSVGILVSTYNWPQALEVIFKSIMQQTHQPDEILIADDGSGAETAALIERYRSIFNIPLKHAWQEDAGFRKSTILNKAIKLAEADYIIEIDGDIVLHPAFIEDHVRHARRGIFVQGARTMISEHKTREILATGQPDINFFSSGISNRFNSVHLPSLSFLIRANSRSSENIKGCNLAFWKDDFIAINGYNNLFHGWGSEDYEFAARLINTGVLKRRLKLAAVCYHLHHSCNSREQEQVNQRRYSEAVVKRLTFCTNGYAEV